jgi:hypothetical protein
MSILLQLYLLRVSTWLPMIVHQLFFSMLCMIFMQNLLVLSIDSSEYLIFSSKTTDCVWMAFYTESLYLIFWSIPVQGESKITKNSNIKSYSLVTWRQWMSKLSKHSVNQVHFRQREMLNTIFSRVYPLLGNDWVNTFPRKHRRAKVGRPLLVNGPVNTPP